MRIFHRTVETETEPVTLTLQLGLDFLKTLMGIREKNKRRMALMFC